MTGVEVPEGLTFESYHPSMAPIFETLAERAREDGRIEEYDHMASVLGFPSFEDLGLSVTKCAEYVFDVEVEVTRMVTVTVRAHGNSEGEAWDAIDNSYVREALQSDNVEYDDFTPDWDAHELIDTEECDD